jgi:hypothetical protein
MERPIIYTFLVLAAFNTPLQGLPNFIVYLYPMYSGCWIWFVSLMGLEKSSKSSTDASKEHRMESVEEPSNGKEGVQGEMMEEEHAQQEPPQGNWRLEDI